MNKEEIKRRIMHCINKIYEDDYDLFDRDNYEVTVSVKLAQYLFIEFKEYDVDCEYNKHKDKKKYSHELNKSMRPDIVVHKRGCDEKNLVFIEIKKKTNKSKRADDFAKIIAATNQNREYGYTLGVFIDFPKNKEKLVMKYFENGMEV